MAKSKARKSETIKLPIQDDGFISKNKKRKEKRLSLNLAAKKMETEEFIPVKRTSLFVAKNAKTPEKSKLLSFNNKQKTPNQSVKNTKGILKNTPNTKNATPTKNNTPNSKGTSNKAKNTPKSIMKETLKRKAEEFIEDEASEGEEPITHKEVKPYEKGRKKSMSFQPDHESDEESEQNETDEDSDNEPNVADFVDAEASEGEETDDEEEEGDDDDESGASEDDALQIGEESSGDEEEEKDDEDEEDSSDSEAPSELPSKKQKKLVSAEPKKMKKEPAVVTNQKVKMEPVPTSDKKVKKKAEKQNPQSQPEKNPQPSDYALFIRNVPKTVSKDEIKSALVTKLDPSRIVEIVQLPKSTIDCYLVYVAEKDDLEALVNIEFSVGTFKFIPAKARESAKSEETHFKVFFPRVPVSISDEVLKKLVEDVVGSGKVVDVRSFRVVPKFQNRNIIIQLSNIDDLKKVIIKNRFDHNGSIVIARQAQESVCKLTIHKVVFSNVPEGITAETLKKEIENVVGKNTVENVVFSFKSQAFSFVTFKNEANKTKALDLEGQFAIQGVPLKVKDFMPRVPVKRGRFHKREGASKRRKTEDGNTAQSEGAGKKKNNSSKPNQKSLTENSKKNNKTESQLNGKTDEPKDKSPKKNKKKNKPVENGEKVEKKTSPNAKNEEIAKKGKKKKEKANTLQNKKSKA